jgi:hypothetical protein
MTENAPGNGGLLDLWFTEAKAPSKTRPHLYKIEGDVKSVLPGFVRHTAFFMMGGRSYRADVVVPKGNDWKGALAAALESEFERAGGHSDAS